MCKSHGSVVDECLCGSKMAADALVVELDEQIYTQEWKELFKEKENEFIR